MPRSAFCHAPAIFGLVVMGFAGWGAHSLLAQTDGGAPPPVSRTVPVRPAPLPDAGEALHRLPAPDSTDLDASESLAFVECDLPGALALALANHPALREARARIQAAEGNWQQVGLRPNPTIGYTAQEIGLLGSAGQHGLVVQRKFLRGHKLARNRAVANREIQAARIDLRSAEIRLRNEVRWSFYQALVSQRRLEISQQLLEIAGQSLASIEKLRRAEEVAEIDLLESRMNYERGSYRVDQARLQFDGGMRKLAALMGLPAWNCRRLRGDAVSDLPDLQWESLVQRLLSDSPQLQAAQNRVDQARAELDREISRSIPDVTVQVAALYADFEQDPLANVSISRPLQLNDRNQGNIRRARAELPAASFARERIERELLQRMAIRYRDYEEARLKADILYGRILPASRAKLALVQQGVAQGEIDPLTLLASQRENAIAELSAIGAVQVAWQAAIELESFLLVDATQDFDLSSVGF